MDKVAADRFKVYYTEALEKYAEEQQNRWKKPLMYGGAALGATALGVGGYKAAKYFKGQKKLNGALKEFLKRNGTYV